VNSFDRAFWAARACWRSVLLAALVAGFCACSRASEPRWIPLAHAFRPTSPDELAETLDPGWKGMGLQPSEDGLGLWVEVRIEPERWKQGRLVKRSGGPDPIQEWHCKRPSNTGFRGQLGERCRLFSADEEFEQYEIRGRKHFQPKRGFHVGVMRLTLRLDRDEEPSSDLVFAAWFPRGRVAGGRWRTAAREIACDGLPVWSGETARLSCDIPPASMLRFATLARPAGEDGKVELRIELDGSVIFRHEQSIGLSGRTPFHVVPLPASGRNGAVLRFSVAGDPAICIFANPWITPAEVGEPAVRPWGEERTNIVLFVADTFRADNLELYGGDPATCPELNALVQESVAFTNARATSVWTLPTHASMFTGLLPTQHGAIRRGVTFSEELPTLAEHLRRSGYRTVAVTDSAFVSRTYGMDRGFEWFEERENGRHDLGSTLASADELLDRDDGRPTFLFVHTYRTHEPYRQGPEESTAAYDELKERIRKGFGAWDGKADPRERLMGYAKELLALYRGGASALDAQFAEWVERLRARGFFQRGCLLFTSDHGEAFGEHDDRGHGRMPHEEKLRIPLFVHGDGFAPRRIDHGVSLIDLAPTISALAELTAPSEWIGSAMLDLNVERPLFAYNWNDEGSYFALTLGEKKILARAGSDADPSGLLNESFLVEAYRLSDDRSELENLLGQDTWPQEIAREHAELWRRLSTLQAPIDDVEISEELTARLRALGYGDSEGS